MKDKNVKVGMKVQIKTDFTPFAKAGDICEVLRRDSDLSHRLKNLRTGQEFYRSAHGYRKVKE